MDELQSGPLMVKALMGRHFADWVILEEWLEDPCLYVKNDMNINEVVGETILDG